MRMGIWRTALLIVLAVIGLALAIRFLGRVFGLLLAAIPLLLIGYLIKRLWSGGRGRRAREEVAIPTSEFDRRHPRLARLERRIRTLDPNLLGSSNGDADS